MIGQVYDASEALFNKLADEARKLQDWAALAWAEAAGSGGSDALEALVEAQCSEVVHWEENLRGLKVGGFMHAWGEGVGARTACAVVLQPLPSLCVSGG